MKSKKRKSEKEQNSDIKTSQDESSQITEKPLKDSLKEALGDPNASKSMKVQINAQIIASWKTYMVKGLPQEEKDRLLEKYAVADELKAPINPPIAAKLTDKNSKQLKKDGYRYDAQHITSLALTVLGGAITMANEAADDEEGVDLITFGERLLDAGKLLTESQFCQTNSRRSCIAPIFPKNIKEALKQTSPDAYLFGSNLPDVLKQIKETESLLDSTKNSSEYKSSGNFKSPSEKRTTSRYQGSSGFIPQSRPRLFFKGSKGRGRYNNYPQDQS